MGIKDIHKQLQKFKIEKEAVKTLKSNKIEISQILKDQMRMTEGADIGEYSAYTQTIKDRSSYIGKWPKPDLFNIGNFQKGIIIETSATDWGFWSNDSKTDDLVKKYTDIIFELNKANIKVVQLIVQQDLAKKIINIFE